ncbi:MAG: 2-C-methyl-D-erythritol 2,4-cyclodiphosphate synthase [Candidatus Omnitrophica bacterium]|nr:2-C-methyl-D-erythritol 2,4-cyclodiphosphate synthase [Candidatus Omnitrophota bacterium]MBU4473100.1 2-C-methyl-D-erythritol 2,4-cyclodiphosphate synthase [Candidatus Omnitrophota bacterium]MCG2706859.1 2-C-methyl-D-erythritol 2,4-cyclodiphosphate synthase [Candidatus Omnitrophota bacterium]
MSHRIGIGYDIHRLVDERSLFIGGVQIPYVKGLLGHSDGDVLLHAISDALLGAIGEGDIGQHFPDTDPEYQNISSGKLLKIVNDLVDKKNFVIGNIDTVIIAQEPKLLPFKKQIQQEISRILKIETGKVNIKAKTNEGVGEIGQKEAIACFAIVTIIAKEDNR